MSKHTPEMMVMPANNTGVGVGILVGQYPGRIGHLYSPGKNPPTRSEILYALDNGAYIAWDNETEWDEQGFRDHLKKYVYARQKPIWILVPDVVTDAKATFERWSRWSEELKVFGIPLALAVQDGMMWHEVMPLNPDVIFVGGSVEWKWKTLKMWVDHFPHVHVGKVNSPEKLWVCHDMGVKSCDGTGWFRGDKRQRDGLIAYLKESSGRVKRQQTHLEMARIYGPEDER